MGRERRNRPLSGLLLVLEGVPAGSPPLGSCTACVCPAVPQSEPEESRNGLHASCSEQAAVRSGAALLYREDSVRSVTHTAECLHARVKEAVSPWVSLLTLS